MNLFKCWHVSHTRNAGASILSQIALWDVRQCYIDMTKVKYFNEGKPLVLHQIFLHKGQNYHNCPLNSKCTHKSYTSEHQGKRGTGLRKNPPQRTNELFAIKDLSKRQWVEKLILSSLTNDKRRSLVPCTAGSAWLKVNLADPEWLSSNSRDFQKFWLFR